MNTRTALLYAERACELRNAEGCGLAALASYALDEANERSSELAGRGCQEEDSFSCAFGFAIIVLDPKRGLHERNEAAQKLGAACGTSEPSACAYLGLAHARGRLGASDGHTQMAALARQACEKDPENLCTWFFPFLAGGGPGSTDFQLLAQLGRRGCQAGDGDACSAAAFVERANGDWTAAATLYEQGCALDSAAACTERIVTGPCRREEWAACRAQLSAQCGESSPHACGALARVLRQGQGGAVDLGAATAAANRGCDGGIGAACFELGVVTQQRGERGWLPLALTAYDRGCREGGVGEACLRAGDGYLLTGRVDRDAALDRFDQACRYGVADGCGFQAAVTLGLVGGGTVASDATAAVGRARDACSRGSGVGCWVDGHANETGLAGEGVDLAAASRLYAKACELKPRFGCDAGAKLELAHLPPRTEAARRLLERGCSVGHTDASCAALSSLPMRGTGKPKRPR